MYQFIKIHKNIAITYPVTKSIEVITDLRCKLNITELILVKSFIFSENPKKSIPPSIVAAGFLPDFPRSFASYSRLEKLLSMLNHEIAGLVRISLMGGGDALVVFYYIYSSYLYFFCWNTRQSSMKSLILVRSYFVGRSYS